MHGKIGSYILLKKPSPTKLVGLLHYNSLTAKKIQFCSQTFFMHFLLLRNFNQNIKKIFSLQSNLQSKQRF